MKLSLAIPWPFLTPLTHTLAVSTNRQHIFGPDVGNSVCVCCLFCETVSPRGRHHVHVPSQPHPSVRLQATQEGVLLLCWVANWGATRGAGVSAGLVPGLHRVPGKKQGRERAWPLVSSQPGALFLWETWEGEAQAVLGRLDVSCLPSLRARALAGTCACMEVVGSGQGLLWDRHR